MAPVTWDPNDLTPFFDEEEEFSWEDKVRGRLQLRIIFEPDGFTSGSIGLYGNSRCSLWVCVCVCLCVCDAWVCTDHEIYVVAVIVAS